ncbi:MAG: polysaccharide deacetylase family protein [Andreesenia angusta]|nr:polysaccharide deacetylase family protein [Andreesenia angusta]
MKFSRYQRRIISLLVLALLLIGIISLVRLGIDKYRNRRINTTKIENRRKPKKKKRDKEKAFNLIIEDEIKDTSKYNIVVTDDDIYISVEDIAKLLNGNEQWNSENKKYILNCLNTYTVIDMEDKTITNSRDEEMGIRIVGGENNKKVSLLKVLESLDYKTDKLYSTSYYWSRPFDYEMMPVELVKKYQKEINYKVDNYESKYNRERKEFEEEFPNKKKDRKMRRLEGDKVIYLTINNGPNKYTEDIFKSIQDQEVNATFFLQGKTVDKNKALVKKIYESGNTIGLQGMTGRPEILYSSVDKFMEEMNKERKMVKDIIGVTPSLIRPLFGSYPDMTKGYRDAAITEGYRIWDWNIDSGDAKSSNIDSNTIYETVMSQISASKPNIVLLHCKKETAQAIPYIIEDLKTEGYRFD